MSIEREYVPDRKAGEPKRNPQWRNRERIFRTASKLLELESEGYDNPDEMFEAAFRDLHRAADRMVQNKAIAVEGEYIAHVSVDPRAPLRALVDNYGGRIVRTWLAEVIELIGGEDGED